MVIMQYYPLLEYESNIKKIDDLWDDFTFEKASLLYSLLKQQDSELFKPYLWDRVNINLSCKNII